MIVCFNCKQETKAKMDNLLGAESYSDYSELLAAAIDNLWILEKEVAEKGSIIIGESVSTTNSGPESPQVKQPPVLPQIRSTSALSHRVEKRVKSDPKSKTLESVHVPGLFQLDGLDRRNAETIEVNSDERNEDGYTLDRWLFGQYNKLLPIKANCRALMRFAVEYPEGIPIKQVAPQIGEAAALLGDYLADHDIRHQIGRDDLLATAFPRSGVEAEKSRARYANQFVGSVNNQGMLSGLLWEYRMVALVPGREICLKMTKPAIRFAQMTNPILDDCQADPTQKFLPEEAAFLLDHIHAYVPVEAFAFRTLIHAIVDGAVTPDKLDEALRVHVPAETNRSLSPSFLTSQRSGALSRMADLGLITRERRGVRVIYLITSTCEKYL